ncbi:MAG: glycosyltransferase [Paludibacteraceae bacterium]|nr:glycosyltransferase [Paludibacteraceae bacterium]
MIPKIIHYCWFGRGKMPELAHKCIESWKKQLPEYDYKLWNEDNFDINSVPYVKEAYEARKFAFVTDYVRLYALYHVGGVYMDTDVEVLKPLDRFLELPAFSGFESDKEIPTGIMASEQHGEWAKEMLDYYGKDRHFLLPDGSLDMTTNVQIIGGLMQANGFIMENGYQTYKNGIMHLFPKDYFCPKGRTGIITLTENSYCIHHFNGSWNTPAQKRKRWFFQHLLGPRLTTFLVKCKRKLIGKERNNL